jgi:cytochrome c oxidase subunit 1
MRYGKPANNNPWNAKGLEWQSMSPPPVENFDEQPVVEEAYAYAPYSQEDRYKDGKH